MEDEQAKYEPSNRVSDMMRKGVAAKYETAEFKKKKRRSNSADVTPPVTDNLSQIMLDPSSAPCLLTESMMKHKVLVDLRETEQCKQDHPNNSKRAL